MDHDHQYVSRRTLILSVYLPSGLLAITQGLLLPTLPLYALEFDVGFTAASMAIAAAGIGTMIADVPAGMVLGQVGLKRTMLIGAALVAASLFALGFSNIFAMLIVYRLIDGVGRAMWSISRVSYITEEIHPRERGRAISIFGGLNRIGMFIGPAVGGFVGHAYGLEASFMLAGMLGVAALIVSMIFIEETPIESHGGHRMRWGLVRQMVIQNKRDLSAASIAQIAAQMIRQGRQALIPFYAGEVLGLDAAQVGLIQSASSMVDMTLFFPAGFIMDRFGRKFTSVPSFALMAVGIALIPLATGFLSMMAIVMIIGFGNGLGSGAMMTLGSDLAPRGAVGEFMGVWRFVGDSGRASGPIVVGGLADLAGWTTTTLILALVGAGSAATLALLVKETRDHQLTIETNPASD